MKKLIQWYHDNSYRIRKASFSLLVVMVVVGLTTTFALHYFINSPKNQQIAEQYPPYPVYDVYGNPVEYNVVAPPDQDIEEELALAQKEPTIETIPEPIPEPKKVPDINERVEKQKNQDAEPVESQQIEQTANVEKKEQAVTATAVETVAEQEEAVLIPPLARPCNGMVTKEYGMAYSETYGDYRHHAGVDLLITQEPEVYAAASGTVKSITKESDGRLTMVIEHDGYITTYKHLTETHLAINDKVKQNQEIGKIDAVEVEKGNGSEHVHFEITSQGKSIDPTGYMSNLE